MIRISFDDHLNQAAYTFTSFPIRIGKGKKSDVDLSFSPLHFEWNHLTLVSEGGKIYCLNTTHDPFVTIDDLPFGKIEINEDVCVTLGEFTLHISLEKDPSGKEKEEPDEPLLDPLSEEELAHLLDKANLTTTPSPFLPSSSNIEEKETKKFSWRWLGVGALTSALFLLLLLLALLTRLTEKEERNEMRAAQGMADIAMALLHAKIYPKNPIHHNWTTPDLIKEHLEAILPPHYPPAFSIDSHGQFYAGTYSMRIYSDKNRIHFFLVGQPKPNFWSRLRPHPILAIDSHTMELRRLENFRDLHRLLSYPFALEGSVAQEISAILNKGEIIRLAKLSVETQQPEFAPPSSLAWLYPGSENYIYNSPRYYLLTQPLIKKLSLTDPYSSKKESLEECREEIRKWQSLPHLITYIMSGKKGGEQMQKWLEKWGERDLHVGYLSFDADGKISQAHMIKEKEKQETTLSFRFDKIPPSESYDRPILSLNGEREEEAYDPLLLEIHKILAHRRQQLASPTQEIIDLLQREQHMPQTAFSSFYEKMSENYRLVREEENRRMSEKIIALSQVYSHLPFQNFVAYLDEIGLGEYFHPAAQCEWLKNGEEIEKAMETISATLSWDDLHSSLLRCKQFLTIEMLPNQEQLVYYQNRLRNKVIDHLHAFLFSPSSPLSSDNFVKKERENLLAILENAWINDQEEQHFFLHAFDEVLEENREKT